MVAFLCLAFPVYRERERESRSLFGLIGARHLPLYACMTFRCRLDLVRYLLGYWLILESIKISAHRVSSPWKIRIAW